MIRGGGNRFVGGFPMGKVFCVFCVHRVIMIGTAGTSVECLWGALDSAVIHRFAQPCNRR